MMRRMHAKEAKVKGSEAALVIPGQFLAPERAEASLELEGAKAVVTTVTCLSVPAGEGFLLEDELVQISKVDLETSHRASIRVTEVTDTVLGLTYIWPKHPNP